MSSMINTKDIRMQSVMSGAARTGKRATIIAAFHDTAAEVQRDDLGAPTTKLDTGVASRHLFRRVPILHVAS
ncbi:hypothetical protein TNCV_3803291 [Trichonephila clavipes]|nr:hypothetical protein TNCV_3803291 [Trichonephila clavipes]